MCRFADMCKLPTGTYQAQGVRKNAIPAPAKRDLRGSDLWNCIRKALIRILEANSPSCSGICFVFMCPERLFFGFFALLLGPHDT